MLHNVSLLSKSRSNSSWEFSNMRSATKFSQKYEATTDVDERISSGYQLNKYKTNNHWDKSIYMGFMSETLNQKFTHKKQFHYK